MGTAAGAWLLLGVPSGSHHPLGMARCTGDKAPGPPLHLLHQPLAASSASRDPAGGVKRGCSRAGLGEAARLPRGWEALETPVSS